MEKTADATFHLPPGAHQAFMYAARNVAATAATHVWFHLKDRVRRFVIVIDARIRAPAGSVPRA
eukprot:scaffold32301_cov135-Isochrysis_galbana.AAC.15